MKMSPTWEMRVVETTQMPRIGGLVETNASSVVRARQVTGDGDGLVTHAGVVWLGEVADLDQRSATLYGQEIVRTG